MLAKNLREIFFQHEIKEFSVVQLFVICPASHCYTEAFCLVLLPAMIKFPMRFVGMAKWGAGRSATWQEGSSPCCQLLCVVRQPQGTLSWGRT